MQVQVKGREKNKFQQTITARHHNLASDAPTEFGGDDAAPNPHELLLAALGSCTTITLQMYSKRKGWDLQEVTVECRDEEIEDPDQPGKKMTKISRDISVTGNLQPDQVEGLKAVADKCPIHKLLTGPKTIKTEIQHLASV